MDDGPVSSCPINKPSPPRDGMEMTPAPAGPLSTPSIDTVTIGAAPTAQFLYHGVIVTVGVGPDPAVVRAVVDSIAYDAGARDTPVTGVCARNPAPDTMPKVERVGEPLVLDPHQNVTLEPLEPGDAPAASAAAVWGHGERSSLLRYRLFFARFSSDVPARTNPDGSLTPLIHHTLGWVVYATPFGSVPGCGLNSIDLLDAAGKAQLGMSFS
jgi:hypothetical protein